MPKIELEVDQVLTTAVALDIEPGDKLIVVNGVIVGMIERRRGPLLEHRPAPEMAAAPVWAKGLRRRND